MFIIKTNHLPATVLAINYDQFPSHSTNFVTHKLDIPRDSSCRRLKILCPVAIWINSVVPRSLPRSQLQRNQPQRRLLRKHHQRRRLLQRNKLCISVFCQFRVFTLFDFPAKIERFLGQ